MGDFSINRSNRVRLSRYLKGKDVLLRGISALKYMELFVEDHFTFDAGKESIEVYATTELDHENYQAIRVRDFSEMDVNDDGEVLCCSMSQVVNDLLEEGNPENLEILVEALANYMEEMGHLDDIQVKNGHSIKFKEIKRRAVEFYG
ncbi:MAG: hypothetical protein FWF59_03955 [Turicibacter sp.]|nr:hypothetical protein [Turicibacter sp.]